MMIRPDEEVTRVAGAIAQSQGVEQDSDGDWYIHGVHSAREMAVAAIEAMPERTVTGSPLTPFGEAEIKRLRHALAEIVARYGKIPARPKNDFEAGIAHEAEQMSLIAEATLATKP